MKKTIVLAALILSTALSTYAQQQAEREGNFTFRIIDNGRAVEITEYVGSNADVRIPERIQKLPVTVIGEKAFVGGELVHDGEDLVFIAGNHLTSISIPSSVTHIGDSAFWANQLTSVSIGSGVTHIGAAAFAENLLSRVNIPESIMHIGNTAFADNQLTSVSIGSSVTNIDDSAFAENLLSSVSIPDSVTHIGDEAFEDNQLTSVSIGSGVRHIGAKAFTGNRLSSVSVPSGAFVDPQAFDEDVQITRR